MQELCRCHHKVQCCAQTHLVHRTAFISVLQLPAVILHLRISKRGQQDTHTMWQTAQARFGACVCLARGKPPAKATHHLLVALAAVVCLVSGQCVVVVCSTRTADCQQAARNAARPACQRLSTCVCRAHTSSRPCCAPHVASGLCQTRALRTQRRQTEGETFF